MGLDQQCKGRVLARGVGIQKGGASGIRRGHAKASSPVRTSTRKSVARDLLK